MIWHYIMSIARVQCKHELAVSLASALAQFKSVEATDAEFAAKLSEASRLTSFGDS